MNARGRRRRARARAAEGRGRPRYPEPLRQRVVAHVHERRARGASLRQLADELGLAVPTLVRRSGLRPAFRPVVVEPAPQAAPGHLVVHGPGYSRYEALAKGGGRFGLAHCRAHVRRTFVECEAASPRAAEALSLNGTLYALERLCEPTVSG